MIGDALIAKALTGAYSHSQAMQAFVETIVQAALKHHGGSIADAGRSLGIKRQTLSMMLKNKKPWSRNFKHKI